MSSAQNFKNPPSVPPASFAAAQVHALPAGMRDLLPEEARAQSLLARSLLGSFALHGYELVTLPIFEYASVLERGLGSLAEDEVLRFIEPETGRVVALRPDMTTQIARLLSARLADAPGPARLCYQGSVLRRRRERARRERQIPQAGVELVGLSGLEGDLEVLGVAAASARAAGLSDFALDLGHAGIAGALLEGVAEPAQAAIVEALGVRDTSEVTRRAERYGVRGASLEALGALPSLHGAESVWPLAERALANTPARACLDELKRLWEAAGAAGVAPRLLVDLAETRNLAYYTGAMFQLHAKGPGRALGSGGRYDGLLGRFGRARPAAGFSFGLDELAWALELAEKPREPAPRLLVTGSASEVLSGLRGCGLAAAEAPAGDPLAYARAWRYTHLVETTLNTATLVRVDDLAREALPRDARALGAAARALLELGSQDE
ncbi:MAG TPA: ATP phosphoribosyltransferase regulatory subunit [Polyangiaceae bacterium]